MNHLVMTRADQGIVPKIATDVGGYDFTVDAIAWNKILVLAGGSSRCRRATVARLPRSHGEMDVKNNNDEDERGGWVESAW